jgi:hypothetical protein
MEGKLDYSGSILRPVVGSDNGSSFQKKNIYIYIYIYFWPETVLATTYERNVWELYLK